MFSQTFPKLTDKEWAILQISHAERFLRYDQEITRRHEENIQEDPHFEARKESIKNQINRIKNRKKMYGITYCVTQ